MTPTVRTLALLRRQGYLAAVVEKWIAQTKQRKDLFGFIDILAVREGEILAVQATTGSHVADRMTKAIESENIERVLKSGIRFEVWGWAKQGARGKAKKWQVSRRPITLADLPAKMEGV